jgi:Beta-lactamase enzyme family
MTVCMVISVVVVGGIRRWQEIAAGPPVPSAWESWALLDRRTGAITGSANLAVPNHTESLVKAWIAADDLRQLTTRHRKPDDDEVAALTTMIRDSDDRAAQTIYRRNGGDEVIDRLISVCGLTETTVHANWWSLTGMSARDAARMGRCIADGRAAGPLWTEWVLAQMRQVRGEGRFGIVSAFPPPRAALLAIKNGWTLHQPGDEWSVNCLAIAGDWILAVEVRYPPALGGLAYGAKVCADAAREHVA